MTQQIRAHKHIINGANDFHFKQPHCLASISLEPVERAIETHSASSKRLSSPGTEQLRNYRDGGGGGGGDDASSIDSKCARSFLTQKPERRSLVTHSTTFLSFMYYY